MHSMMNSDVLQSGSWLHIVPPYDP